MWSEKLRDHLSHDRRRFLRICGIAGGQNSNFNANCSSRGVFLVLVTMPKFGLPSVLFGVPKMGVFVRLNDSARNSNPALSVIGNLRKIERSRFFVLSLRKAFLPKLP